MQNIRNLVGSRLIDVETNVNGFTVLYFENQEGKKLAVDLSPTIRDLEEQTAQEVPVQEQYIGKCEHCNKHNEIILPTGLEPKFCTNCGKIIQYIKKESLLQK